MSIVSQIATQSHVVHRPGRAGLVWKQQQQLFSAADRGQLLVSEGAVSLSSEPGQEGDANRARREKAEEGWSSWAWRCWDVQDGKLDLEEAPWYPQLKQDIIDKAEEERAEMGQRAREVAATTNKRAQG